MDNLISRSLTRPAPRSLVRPRIIPSGLDLAALVRPKTPVIPSFFTINWPIAGCSPSSRPARAVLQLRRDFDQPRSHRGLFSLCHHDGNDRTNFPDYPKYGMMPDAYYISTREFLGSGGPFPGCRSVRVESRPDARGQSRLRRSSSLSCRRAARPTTLATDSPSRHGWDDPAAGGQPRILYGLDG